MNRNYLNLIDFFKLKLLISSRCCQISAKDFQWIVSVNNFKHFAKSSDACIIRFVVYKWMILPSRVFTLVSVLLNAACILKACFKWVGYSKGNVIVCFSESYWVRTYELLTGNLNSDSGLGTISSLYVDLNSGCNNGWAVYMKCPKRECHYMIAFVANIIKS